LIAAFDLDGTLLNKNSSFAFCHFLYKKGFFSKFQLTYCVYAYTRHLYFGLSLWDLHTLIFQRLFFGKTLDSLAEFAEPFLKETFPNLMYMPAIKRLETFQKEGITCMILSNSPYFLVREIANKLNIEHVFATEYILNGKQQLMSLASLLDGKGKARILNNFSPKKIIAFSDSHLDLPFLQAAQVAVAVNPNRRLKKIALKKGWEIL
jgi:HAD superfamily hydrolase (TIGR01490 family)